MSTPLILANSDLPCKKNCLDSNHVIWNFLVLDLHEFWLYKIDDMTGVNRNINDMAGCKLKFSQITRSESILNFVIWCHEGPKPKNL